MTCSNQFFPELIKNYYFFKNKKLLLFRSINKLNLALSNIKIHEYLLTLAKSVVYLF